MRLIIKIALGIVLAAFLIYIVFPVMLVFFAAILTAILQ